MHFDSIFGESAFWEIHHAGTVYHDIDGWDIVPGENFSGGFSDGFLA